MYTQIYTHISVAYKYRKYYHTPRYICTQIYIYTHIYLWPINLSYSTSLRTNIIHTSTISKAIYVCVPEQASPVVITLELSGSTVPATQIQNMSLRDADMLLEGQASHIVAFFKKELPAHPEMIEKSLEDLMGHSQLKSVLFLKEFYVRG